MQLEESPTHGLPWIRVCENSPYFEDENGASWTPIGQNDAITWPDFQGLFKRQNPALVEGHMAFLAAHGVTCIRMMMEYCQTENRYLEKPVGKFQANMVQFWDDLFALCKKYNIRVLVTPFDTFWMARRWKYHPYNKISGGPCSSKWQWLSSAVMLTAIKNRFDFFIERWGEDGSIFGWDLWNEINPIHAGRHDQQLVHFIERISVHIREKELALYGKSHLQTVSVFEPILAKHDIAELIFRHPMLDFSTTHFYEFASIDNPRNTYSAAIMTGIMVKNALEKTASGRPFLDSEHGPILYFRRNKRGLPEAFDDEYYLHMQWAHLASGGAGGGMRWPYRYPHVLTHGMRRAQKNMSEFAELINWQSFNRKNLNDQLSADNPNIHTFGCGDANQAIIWLLSVKAKKRSKTKSSMISSPVAVPVPGLDAGNYKVHLWSTLTGLASTLR